jgi:hypothetical protein
LLKLTLTSGETIVGTPNYVTTKIADLKLVNDGFRTVRRCQITKIERVKRDDA